MFPCHSHALHLLSRHSPPCPAPDEVGDVEKLVRDEEDGGPPAHVGHDLGGRRGHVHCPHHPGEPDPGPLHHACHHDHVMLCFVMLI